MGNRALKSILIFCITISLIVVLIFGLVDFLGVETSSKTYLYNDGAFLAIVLILLCFENKKKRYYFKRFMVNDMSESMISELIEKNVDIRTLDEYVSGVVKSIDGDFIIVEKIKKNGSERIFINKNSIQTIRIK
ncbi:MAG: hypothetical protein MJ066_04670 [Clostridia bacterium]|nr:hypothetical protein [Clostridia bacterium]